MNSIQNGSVITTVNSQAKAEGIIEKLIKTFKGHFLKERRFDKNSISFLVVAKGNLKAEELKDIKEFVSRELQAA